MSDAPIPLTKEQVAQQVHDALDRYLSGRARAGEFDYKLNDASDSAPKRMVLRVTRGDWSGFKTLVNEAVAAARAAYASQGITIEVAYDDTSKESVILVLWGK